MPLETITCQREGCDNQFVPKRPWAKFCSPACRKDHCRQQTAAKAKPQQLPTAGKLPACEEGQVIRKPLDQCSFHPQNITKMDDRTTYYRGNGVFGYADSASVLADESSIE